MPRVKVPLRVVLRDLKDETNDLAHVLLDLPSRAPGHSLFQPVRVLLCYMTQKKKRKFITESRSFDLEL